MSDYILSSSVWEFGITLANFGFQLLIQFTIILSISLLVLMLLKHRSAVVRSTIIKATVTALFLAPIAYITFSSLGVSLVNTSLPGITTQRNVARSIDSRSAADTSSSVSSNTNFRPLSPSFSERTRPLGNTTENSHKRISEERAGAEPKLQSNEQKFVATDTSTESTQQSSTAIASSSPNLTSSFFVHLTYVVLGFVWLGISTIMMARLATAIMVLAQYRRRARTAGSNIVKACEETARQLGVRAPRVLVSPDFESPCLVGILKPTMLIPVGSNSLSREVLAHELAHLKRNDCAWKLAAQLVACLVPWHPLVKRLITSMEYCFDEACDDVVIESHGDRHSYANELLELAEKQQAKWAIESASLGVVLNSSVSRRVIRILDTTRSIQTNTATPSKVLFLTLGIGLALTCGLIGVTNSPGSPMRFGLSGQDEARENSDVKGQGLIVTGQVVLPNGEPSEAKIWFNGKANVVSWASHPQDVKWQQLAIANSDGRFKFELTQAMIEEAFGEYPDGKIQLIATHKGYGFAIEELTKEQLEEAQPLQFKLVDDLPVKGRLVQSDGNPAVGVTISLVSAKLHEKEPTAQSIQEWELLSSGYYTNYRVDAPRPPEFAPMKTDNEGRFELHGIGAQRSVRLEIAGGGIGASRLNIWTVSTPEDVPGGTIQVRSGLAESSYFAEFTHITSPAKTIYGTVVDAETQEPIPGVITFATRTWHSRLNPITTDENGNFRIEGIPLGSTYELEFDAPDAEYFREELLLEDDRLSTELEVKVEMRRGILVKGIARNVRTGKPITGTVTYDPLFGNETIAELFPDRRCPHPFAKVQTDTEGRFEISVLPGPGMVAVSTGNLVDAEATVVESELKELVPENIINSGMFEGEGITSVPLAGGRNSAGIVGVWDFNAIELINLEDGETLPAVELEYDPGVARVLRFFDENGDPLSGVNVYGRGVDGQRHSRQVMVETECSIGGLLPGRNRKIFLVHQERKLGAAITVTGDENTPIEVTLKPTGSVTGRLVDSAGHPLAAAKVEARPWHSSSFVESPWYDLELDDDGRFQLDLVIAGYPFSVTANTDGNKLFRVVVSRLEVESGQIMEAGTYKDYGRYQFGKVEDE